jgi:DNA-binding NarL/FixJ family response regulator
MAIRIVVVDDHNIMRDGLRMILEKEDGFVVVGEAEDARTAVECTLREQPEVVIMDLQLPDETGVVAAARILASRPATKIVMLTAALDRQSIQQALRAGAVGYVVKDEAAAELVRAVHSVVKGKVHLSPTAATALVDRLRGTAEVAPPTTGVALSERETTVLTLLVDGLRNKEIADRMNVSPKTVETYRARILTKLGYSSTAELVRYAVRTGLIDA